jgi:hypothetical protein
VLPSLGVSPEALASSCGAPTAVRSCVESFGEPRGSPEGFGFAFRTFHDFALSRS